MKCVIAPVKLVCGYVAVVLLLLGLGVVRANAATSGPAYYLSTSATYSGPCFNNGSVTDVPIATTFYRGVFNYGSTEGNVTYYHFTEYGFNRAYRYVVCLHGNGTSGYVFKYYGADDGKLVRHRTDAVYCYGGSCWPDGASYTPWVRQDWI